MRVIAKSTLKRFWQRPGCADARGVSDSRKKPPSDSGAKPPREPDHSSDTWPSQVSTRKACRPRPVSLRRASRAGVAALS